MLTRIRERISTIPRGAWLAIGGVVILLVAAIAVLLILDPFGGPYQRLTAAKPAYTHPDGLVLQLAPGIGEADIQVSTIPREVFTAGDAGGDWQEAQKALPPSITPLSPIYTIKVKRWDPLESTCRHASLSIL